MFKNIKTNSRDMGEETLKIQKISRILDILLIIVLSSIILPVLAGCFYTGPSSDDYVHLSRYVHFDRSGFLFPFKNMSNYYIDGQGSFFGCFIMSLPIYHLFGIWGFRITMLIIVGVFLYVLINMIRTFFEYLGLEGLNPLVLLFTVFFLFYLLGFNKLDEVFYWFNGASIYTVPAIFGFISITCFIKYRMKPNNMLIIFGAISAFLGSGGGLNVTALLCETMLILTFCCFLDKKSFDKSMIIALAALAGALTNAFAPGNFKRYDNAGESSGLFEALRAMPYRINESITQGIKDGFLLFIILLAFLVAYKYSRCSEKSFKFECPGIITALCYIGMLITDFPVILGYGTTLWSGRVDFIEKLSIALFSAICASYWGGWTSKKEKLNFRKEHIFILVFICIIPLSSWFDLNMTGELTPYKMVLHFAGNNDFAIAAKEREMIVEQTLNSTESDVVIYVDQKPSDWWINVREIRIRDKDYWVNPIYADYYGKDSVELVVREQ